MSEKSPDKFDEPIGEGRDKKVYPDAGNKDRVIAEFKEHIEETPNQIKARYYLTKILHLILPKNIPDMHMAGSEPNVYKVDKIEVDESQKVMQEFATIGFSAKVEDLRRRKDKNYLELTKKALEAASNNDIDKDIYTFRRKIDELGIYSLDDGPVNFSKDKDGNVQYLDSFSAWDAGHKLLFGYEDLKIAIESLPENDKKTATNFLERMMKLYYDEENKLSNGKNKIDERK